jgi:hypothetical protein
MHKPSRTTRREFWRRILARPQRPVGSAVLSAGAPARRYGLCLEAFRQEAGRGRAATLPAVGFAPLRVIPEALGWLPGGLIEILLPADRRVRLAGKVDKAMLAAVVAVLTAAGLDGQEG